MLTLLCHTSSTRSIEQPHEVAATRRGKLSFEASNAGSCTDCRACRALPPCVWCGCASSRLQGRAPIYSTETSFSGHSCVWRLVVVIARSCAHPISCAAVRRCPPAPGMAAVRKARLSWCYWSICSKSVLLLSHKLRRMCQFLGKSSPFIICELERIRSLKG